MNKEQITINKNTINTISMFLCLVVGGYLNYQHLQEYKINN